MSKAMKALAKSKLLAGVEKMYWKISGSKVCQQILRLVPVSICSPGTKDLKHSVQCEHRIQPILPVLPPKLDAHSWLPHTKSAVI